MYRTRASTVLTALVIAALAVIPTAMARGSQAVAFTDATGDAFVNNKPAPAYQDTTRVEVAKKDGRFIFTMDVAASIPKNPPLLPPANNQIWWFFGITRDLSVAPQGYPSSEGTMHLTWWDVVVSWDGTSFRGIFIDRLPLLTGGDAVVTSIPFTIKGSQIRMFVDPALMGNPPDFLWASVNIDWSSAPGSEDLKFVDWAPEFPSGVVGTWPA